MRRYSDFEMVAGLVCLFALAFGVLSLNGCRQNHYYIKTEYKEPITNKDTRTIESVVEGYSSARDISKIYMNVFDFVNREMMKK